MTEAQKATIDKIKLREKVLDVSSFSYYRPLFGAIEVTTEDDRALVHKDGTIVWNSLSMQT